MMLDKISKVVLVASLMVGGAAGAYAQDRSVPAGDSLAQTPSQDVTRSQVQSAPPQDKAEVRSLEREGAVKPTH